MTSLWVLRAGGQGWFPEETLQLVLKAQLVRGVGSPPPVPPPPCKTLLILAGQVVPFSSSDLTI